MYDEAVSFFEHIIRKDRPVREILFADYTFLNQPLAKFYGVKKEIKSTSAVELVEGASSFQRGGLLRLGAVLTATSAPLRTSPVKRGDWVLRRILGTPVPPPPADAGSRFRPTTSSSAASPCKRKARGAQAQCDLRQLPRAHRSARLLAGALRFHRPLARKVRRRQAD